METEIVARHGERASVRHQPPAEAKAMNGAERRHWERIPVTIPLFVRAVADGRRVLEFANVVNISAGGALLAVRRFVRRPVNISLEIPAAPVADTAALPASARMMEAKVLRVESAERCYLWAVRFRRPLAVARPAKVRRPPARREKARAAHV
ncbi:MAG: PilZ domain-containing protein [Terriglobales bacterium]